MTLKSSKNNFFKIFVEIYVAQMYYQAAEKCGGGASPQTFTNKVGC